jgi:hypothetical protein
VISLRIAKLGYYGGDPAKVREARVDDVMAIIEFEEFHGDLETATYELNREKV